MKLISDEGERYTVSQLAARAGISTASIKFYRRLGLLRSGDPAAEKKAYYDQAHLRRLVLIRSLRELAQLSVQQVKKLTETLDSSLVRLSKRPSRTKVNTFDLVAAAVDALAPPRVARTAQAKRALATVRQQVHDKLTARGLTVRDDSATLDSLAQALLGLRVFVPVLDVDLLDPYLDHIVPLAQAEVSANEARILSGPESALIGALVGTVLFEPLILALRRLAHEHFARELVVPSRPARRGESRRNQDTVRTLPLRGR